jgi:nicotinamidase-related amidase
VHATVKDALAEGFKVILVQEACKGVSAQDSEKAVDTMKENGVQVVKNIEELRKLL